MEYVSLFSNFTWKIYVPVSIFSLSSSPLESLCIYLKDGLNLSYSEIARWLNRDPRNVRWSYLNGKKKVKKLKVEYNIMVPLSVLTNKEFTIFENLVMFLHDELKFSFTHMSRLLNRSVSTIYTVYMRGKIKYER